MEKSKYIKKASAVIGKEITINTISQVTPQDISKGWEYIKSKGFRIVFLYCKTHLKGFRITKDDPKVSFVEMEIISNKDVESVLILFGKFQTHFNRI